MTQVCNAPIDPLVTGPAIMIIEVLVSQWLNVIECVTSNNRIVKNIDMDCKSGMHVVCQWRPMLHMMNNIKKNTANSIKHIMI